MRQAAASCAVILVCVRVKRIMRTDALLTGPDGHATDSDQDDCGQAGSRGAGGHGAEDKSRELGDLSQQLLPQQHHRVTGNRKQETSPVASHTRNANFTRLQGLSQSDDVHFIYVNYPAPIYHQFFKIANGFILHY